MRVVAIRNKARDVRLLGFGLVGLYAFSASRWEASALVSGSMLVSGLILVGIATSLRTWAVLYIAGYKTRSLITEGPFSICRNPIYLSTLIGALGIALSTATLTFPVLVLVVFLPYLMVQIRGEEVKLAIVHGKLFDSYRSATPRLIPDFSKYSEPQDYIVQPVAFRRWMLDSLWFVWGIGIVALLEAMHRTSLIPVLFRVA